MVKNDFKLNNSKENIEEVPTSLTNAICMNNIMQNVKSAEVKRKDDSVENATLERINSIINEFLVDEHSELKKINQRSSKITTTLSLEHNS